MLTHLEGKRFNRWTVLAQAPPVHHTRRWFCICDCESIRVVRQNHLLSGGTKSCGCLGLERRAQAKVLRGTVDSVEYKTWRTMIWRCHEVTPENRGEHYKNYRGRGIAVCDRWRNSFDTFLADMGPRPGPGYSIDRKDNDGNYEPANCRWATKSEQAKNQRRRNTNGGGYAL